LLNELIAHRYETGSLIITFNQPFSAWDQIFDDNMMTVAAIDRLVHHATILEITSAPLFWRNLVFLLIFCHLIFEWKFNRKYTYHAVLFMGATSVINLLQMRKACNPTLKKG